MVVSSWALLADGPPRFVAFSPTLQLLHLLTREIIKGHFNGTYHGIPNGAHFDSLKMGDIILLHNPDGAYGYWTHAALYVGAGRTIDANDFSKGTVLNYLSVYQSYDELAIYRPRLPNSLKRRVASVAVRSLGTPYNPFTTIRDQNSEYCSKLIWNSFSMCGVKLCPSNEWIVPDDLARSPILYRIADWKSR